MEIIYREAQPSDAKALLDYLQIIGGESDNLTFGSTGLPFSTEQEAQFLSSKLNDSHSLILLAFDGDKLVGNGSIDGNEHPRLGHRCSLAITVCKSHWGCGIGSGLVERLIDFAKVSKAEVVELQVRSDNERAKALYRKFGFEKFGTYQKFFKIDGKYYDADYMNLYL